MTSIKSNHVILSIIFLCITHLPSFGHALFITTAPTGEIGRSQPVEIFYAEAEEMVKEKTNDWWANVAEFKLWLFAPDGSKKLLETTDHDNHFAANFTPTMTGKYLLAISHAVDKIVGETQYIFNASALVQVGSENKNTDWDWDKPWLALPSPNELLINQTLIGQWQVNDSISQPLESTIIAPVGWMKTIPCSKGKFHFNPIWTGDYFIESIVTTEKDPDSNTPKLIDICTATIHVRSQD